MINWKKYWYWLPVVIVCLGLVLTFQPFILSYIVEPTAVLLWAVWTIISTVSQDTYWLILVAVCLISMMRFIPSWKRTARPSYSYKYAPRNRVEYWQACLNDSSPGASDSALRQNLEQLIYSALTLSRESSLADVQKMIADGRISLPPEIKHFFSPQEKHKKLQWNFPPFASHFLPLKWLHKRMGSDMSERASTAEILDWIEHDLEIRNEQ